MSEAFEKACDYAEALRRMGKTYEEAHQLLEQAWDHMLSVELADYRRCREEERWERGAKHV